MVSVTYYTVTRRHERALQWYDLSITPHHKRQHYFLRAYLVSDYYRYDIQGVFAGASQIFYEESTNRT